MPNTLQYEAATRYVTVSGNGTVVSRPGEGVLHRITGNTGTGRLRVYDGTAIEPEDVVADLTLGSENFTAEYGLNLTSGITVVGDSIASGGFFTVVYQ
jgi:hypothetical protein